MGDNAWSWQSNTSDSPLVILSAWFNAQSQLKVSTERLDLVFYLCWRPGSNSLCLAYESSALPLNHRYTILCRAKRPSKNTIWEDLHIYVLVNILSTNRSCDYFWYTRWYTRRYTWWYTPWCTLWYTLWCTRWYTTWYIIWSFKWEKLRKKWRWQQNIYIKIVNKFYI